MYVKRKCVLLTAPDTALGQPQADGHIQDHPDNVPSKVAHYRIYLAQSRQNSRLIYALKGID